MRNYPEGYLERIEAEIGSGEYRLDYLNNGKLACAFFVSNVLYDLKMLNNVYPKIDDLISALNDNGFWKQIDLKDIEPGDIILWEKNKSGHYHVGFCFDDKQAISNSWKECAPVKHDIEFTNNKLKRQKRNIEKVFALLKEDI